MVSLFPSFCLLSLVVKAYLPDQPQATLQSVLHVGVLPGVLTALEDDAS